MHPLINIAIKAARNASKIILRAIDRLDTISVQEKSPNDFVTDIDQQAEQEIINVIHESYPDHAILGEEGGEVGKSDYTWIIDPIDGTSNFIHGHPHFCISIAVKYKERIDQGLIYDPLRDELFIASYGAGAFLNERRIRVAQQKQFKGTVISSSLGKKSAENIGLYLKILAALLPLTSGTRRSGSAALDLAYIACGRIDGGFGIGLKPWDIAAATLIIQEAGGFVTDFNAENNYLTSGNLVAGNANIFKAILEIVQNKI